MGCREGRKLSSVAASRAAAAVKALVHSSYKFPQEKKPRSPRGAICRSYLRNKGSRGTKSGLQWICGALPRLPPPLGLKHSFPSPAKSDGSCQQATESLQAWPSAEEVLCGRSHPLPGDSTSNDWSMWGYKTHTFVSIQGNSEGLFQLHRHPWD